jgi:putative component of membrane protein insertase Oxa1/YidC/SpoIIIJ protein YidD
MAVRRLAVQKIPGLVPGIFFFAVALAAAAGPGLELAADLFAEGQWLAARTESLRVAAEVPGPDAARARLLAAVSDLRLDRDRPGAKAVLAGLWQADAADLETRCMAAYEFGLADWADGGCQAGAALEFAYLQTRDVALFWRAGCSLYFYLKATPALRNSRPDLWNSLQLCRDAWPLEIWRECRPRKPARPAVAALPGRWVVQFYRAQLGPAIGSRCDLQPSCSEYFLQATRAHGLLGVPLIADRFVREPAVVAAAEHPVPRPDGSRRYADPVADHDGWLRGTK